jgi:DNA invertase Pin-like site-specific DNA recombinase
MHRRKHDAIQRAVAETIGHTGLRVRCYYRKSTDDQTTSIEQQQKEVRKFAEQHGYTIVEEYDDPGRSGLLPWRQRPGFLRMLNDCQAKRDCNAILVWHSSRFGRADSQYSQEPKIILRECGIHLISVKEGPIDWNTSMGRIMDTLISEGNNQYSHTLSVNVVRGHLHHAQAGWRTLGAAPYGYDREYVDEKTGVVQVRKKRTERFKGAPDWHVRLVVNEDEAQVVRYIYDEYQKGTPVMAIARNLNLRGLPNPYAHRPRKNTKRRVWTGSSVQVILENRAYYGCHVMGVQTAKRTLNRVEYFERENAWPEIIEKTQWEECHRLMEAKATGKVRPRTGSGALNGVLFCGVCGNPLYRQTSKSGKNTVVYYWCKTSTENPAAGCKCWRAREDVVLPVVLGQVCRALDVETLAALEAKPPKETGRELASMKAKRDDLEAKIDQGTENLLLAKTGTFQLMQDKLDEWKAELDRVVNTINLATKNETSSARQARIEWLKSVKGRLVTVIEPEGMKSATPHPFEPNRHQLDTIHTLLGKSVPGTVYVDGEPITVGVDPYDDDVTYWHYERENTVDRLAAPALVAEAGAVRSLLLQLGLRCVLTWTPADRVHFRLKRAEITFDGATHVHDFASLTDIATFNTSSS